MELLLHVQKLEEKIVTIMEILFINSQLKVNTDLCLYISIVQGSRNYSLSKITQFMKKLVGYGIKYDATVAASGIFWCYSSCVILSWVQVAFTFRFVLSVDIRQITKNAFGMRVNAYCYVHAHKLGRYRCYVPNFVLDCFHIWFMNMKSQDISMTYKHKDKDTVY